MLVLVPTGFFSMFLAQAANHRVQMGVDAEYRGRVMALYVLVFLGTTPIGASAVGWWGQHFGVPSSIWGAGLVCFVAAVAALVWQLRMSGDRVVVRLRPRPRLEVLRRTPEPALRGEALDAAPVSNAAPQSPPPQLPAEPARYVPLRHEDAPPIRPAA
jgi:hypothetical protein